MKDEINCEKIVNGELKEDLLILTNRTNYCRSCGRFTELEITT